MMRRAPSASLVVGLLLASVGPASAECAWVLWEEDESRDARVVTNTSWTAKVARETRADCEEVLEGVWGASQPEAMTLRYSHLAPEHLRAAVAVLDDVFPAGAQAGHKLQRVTEAPQTISS